MKLLQTQMTLSWQPWVKADLLDFVSACQEEVNDTVGHNTVGEVLNDVMISSPHV